MINKEDFNDSAKIIQKNPTFIVPQIITYKKDIQKELQEIINRKGNYNLGTKEIDKDIIKELVILAHKKWRTNADATTLFCVSIAVATIIKECNWGIYYLLNDRLFELANRIQSI